MSATIVLSWLCTTTGLAGLYLAGRKDWRGWVVALVGQPVWVAFALVAHAWPLLISSFAYAAVYARNLVLSRRPESVA